MKTNTETKDKKDYIELSQPIQGITTLATNCTCAFGESASKITVSFQEAKTIRNRIKWWLFCKVFPIRILEWVKKE